MIRFDTHWTCNQSYNNYICITWLRIFFSLMVESYIKNVYNGSEWLSWYKKMERNYSPKVKQVNYYHEGRGWHSFDSLKMEMLITILDNYLNNYSCAMTHIIFSTYSETKSYNEVLEMQQSSSSCKKNVFLVWKILC